MGRRKKVDEIAELAEELVEAAEDGKITEEEIKTIVNDSKDEGEAASSVESEPESNEDPVFDAAPEVLVEEEPVEEEPEQEVPAPVEEPDTKPVEEEPKDKPKSTNAFLLNDATATVAEKVEWCLTEAPTKLRNIAKQLVSYNEAMKPGVVQDEQKMVGKQYELVNIYRTVLNNKSYNEFKASFDLLNLFFLHFKDESLSGYRVFRFDYLWKWSDKELNTLLNLSQAILLLANYETRSQNIKKINLEAALNSETTIVDEEARNNIISYYNK